MGRSRTGRLLVALGLMLLFVVVVVVVIGEVFVRPAVEDEIGKGLADELGLVERPDVVVRGFPLALRALQERLDGIDVSVEGEVFEGLRVEAVDLRIDDIAFDTSELLRGSGTVEVSGGGGRAEITDADVSEYLTSVGLPATVEFAPGSVTVSGAVTIDGVTAQASASGELALVGGVLHFTPTAVEAGAFGASVERSRAEGLVSRHFTFDTPVPRLQGVQLTGVRVGDGVAFVDAAFSALTVEY